MTNSTHQKNEKRTQGLIHLPKLSLTIGFMMMGFFALAKPVESMVFYEGHPISPVKSESSSQLHQFSAGVVGFVLEQDMYERGSQIFLKKVAVHEDNHMCPGQEELKDQFASFYCSGIFVGPQHVLTAGHCVEDVTCRDFSMVRNGQKDRISGPLDPADFYTCRKFYKVAGEDLALVETNETYRGPLPKLQPQSILMIGSPVFMVGHPLGMPLFLARGLIKEQNSSQLVAEISAFEGNSGAPVFSQNSGNLVGILVQGEADFKRDPIKGCQILNRCPKGRCRGERISIPSAHVFSPSSLGPAPSR